MGGVLGDVSWPRTARKPPNPMSSGSGLVSWFRTPISIVPKVSVRIRVSVQPFSLGGEGHPALITSG
jgi:hypothetical protein